MRHSDIRTHLRAGMAFLLPERLEMNALVVASFQDAQRAIRSAPCVYVSWIGSDRRYGNPTSIEKYDPDDDAIKRYEHTRYETSIRISAAVPDERDAGITSSDLIKTASAVAQSEDFQKYLMQNGLNILRVEDIPAAITDNDNGGYHADPNFTLVVLHSDTFIKTIAHITHISHGIHRI